jgi:hypothetical protein
MLVFLQVFDALNIPTHTLVELYGRTALSHAVTPCFQNNKTERERERDRRQVKEEFERAGQRIEYKEHK